MSQLSQHSRTGSLRPIHEQPPAGHAFLTRHGTAQGTITHSFQCVSKSELRGWSMVIEKQTDAAVNMIKHAEFCKLKLDNFALECGFDRFFRWLKKRK